jgi:alkylation response protein AidB-like acyl-CoA dehydrogenase
VRKHLELFHLLCKIGAAMDGWEVLGDAVKIGLGASIGLLGAKWQYKREWEKEQKVRRINALESVTADFERVMGEIVEMSVEIELSRLHLQTLPDASEAGKLIRQKLAGVESRLALMGMKEAARAIPHYREKFNEVVKAMLPEASEAELNKTMTDLFASRSDVYDTFVASTRG